MSATKPDKISEFRRELRDLVLKYDVSLEINTGYYGEVEGVDFCVDSKRVVNASAWGGWDFDDNGQRNLDEIRQGLAKSP